MIQSAVAMTSKRVFSSSSSSSSSSSDSMQVDTLVELSDIKENQMETVMQQPPPKTGENERGKRVLGVLMGTLNRFKNEESENSEAVSTFLRLILLAAFLNYIL